MVSCCNVVSCPSDCPCSTYGIYGIDLKQVSCYDIWCPIIIIQCPKWLHVSLCGIHLYGIGLKQVVPLYKMSWFHILWSNYSDNCFSTQMDNFKSSELKLKILQEYPVLTRLRDWTIVRDLIFSQCAFLQIVTFDCLMDGNLYGNNHLAVITFLINLKISH